MSKKLLSLLVAVCMLLQVFGTVALADPVAPGKFRKYFINDDFNTEGDLGNWRMGITENATAAVSSIEQTTKDDAGVMKLTRSAKVNCNNIKPETRAEYEMDDIDLEGNKIIIEARVKTVGDSDSKGLAYFRFNAPVEDNRLGYSDNWNWTGWSGGCLAAFNTANQSVQYKSSSYQTADAKTNIGANNTWANIKVVIDGTDGNLQDYTLTVWADDDEANAVSKTGTLKEQKPYMYDLKFDAASTKHTKLMNLSFSLRDYANIIYVDYIRGYYDRDVINASASASSSVTSKSSVVVSFAGDKIPTFPAGAVTIEGVECDVTSDVAAQTVSLKPKNGASFTVGDTLTVKVNSALLASEEGVNLTGDTTFNVPVEYGTATASLISDATITSSDSVTVKFDSNVALSNFDEGLVTIEGVECDVTPNISAQTVSLTAKSGRFVPGSTLNVMVNTTVLEETEGIRLTPESPDSFEVAVAYGSATAELISDSVIAANESVTVKFTSTEPIANFADGLVTIEGVECDYSSNATEKTVTLTPKAPLEAGQTYTVKVDTELLKTSEGTILSGPSTFDFSVIPLSVFDVKLDKKPMPEETVSVKYQYAGVNNQGAHTYQWQTASSADAPDGEWINLPNGTESTYTFDYSLNHGSYVRVIMTPYDELGNQGYAVTTEPVMYKIAPSEDEDGVAYRKYYINDDYNEAGNVGNWKAGTTSQAHQTITITQETLEENGESVGALRFYGDKAGDASPTQPNITNRFDKVEFKTGSKYIIETRVKTTGGINEKYLDEGSSVYFKFNRPNDPKYLGESSNGNFRGWNGGTLFTIKNTDLTGLTPYVGIGYKSSSYNDSVFAEDNYTNKWANIKVVIDGSTALGDDPKYTIYVLDDDGNVSATQTGTLKEYTNQTYDMESFVDNGLTTKTKHEDIRSFSFVLRHFREEIFVDYFKFYELRDAENATATMPSGSILRPADSVTIKFTGTKAIQNFAEGLVTIDGVETVMTQDIENQTVTLTPVEKFATGSYHTVRIDKKLLASSEGFVLDGADTFNFNVGTVNVYDAKTTGRLVVGTTLGISYRYADSDNPEGAHLYQWQKSADGITWENISGETNNTYTVTQDIFDNKNYVRILMTPYDNTGVSGAVVETEFLAPETAPVLDNVAVNTNVLFPELYIGPKYDYFDLNGDKIVRKEVQWYISDSAEGPWTPHSTDEYYYTSENDLDKYFKYEIKVVNDGALFTDSTLYTSNVVGPVVKIAETSNMLLNAGFERGDVLGWSTDDGIIEIAGAEGARTGDYAVHLMPRTDVGEDWCQNIRGLTTGKSYILGGWVKKSSPEAIDITNFWPYPWSGLTRVGDDYSYLVQDGWVHAVGAFRATAENATACFVSFHTMKADAYLDDLYFGELIITDIETFTPEPVEIPEEGTKEISLTSGKILNQLGTTHGLLDEKIVLKVPEGAEGITQVGNNLVIDNTAKAGTYTIEVYCKPSYNFPAQEIFQKFVTVNLYGDGNAAPEARDVKVTGVVATGNTLNGSYNYYQVANKPESTSTYQWMWSDAIDGEYAPIAGANSLTYTVESNYADKFIKLAVTPVTFDGIVGSQALSNVVTMPRPPFVTDVSVKGEGKVGGSVEVAYTYNDYNSYNNAKDEEGATTYQWYSSNYADNGFTPIAGATSKTYTFTEKEIDKYVKVEIKPVSKFAPTDGTPVMSSAFFGPTAPVATNVAITKSGTTLTGSYQYNHTHGARETDSVYEWKVNGVLVSNSISYTINFEGTKYVEFSVTPVGDTNPSTGKTYSYGVNMAGISSSGSTGAGGGGGGGTGGGGGGAGSTGVTNINDMKIPEKEVQQPEQTQPKSDLSGHWGEVYVKEMETRGVMKADEKGNYDPDRTVSRSEMISYLFDALKLEEAEYNAEFSDVNALDSYAGKLQAMINNGTIASYHEFRPNDGISREEMCKILFVSLQNAGKLTKSETNALDAFADKASISDWAIDYVNTIFANKIMIGTSDTTFAPKENITRAQVATMLVRILKVIEG